MSLDTVVGRRTISASSIEEIALLRRRADASTVATERGPAALGLALVIFEHEEVIGAGLNLGAS
jgi:hypothetical protein